MNNMLARRICSTLFCHLLAVGGLYAQILSAPVLLSPPDGSANQSLTPTLSWSVVVGAIQYNVEISTTGLFTTTLFNDTTLGTSDQSSPLSYGTTYYWRVRSISLLGPSDWSTVWSFTTVPAIPPAPVLDSPPDGTADLPVTLVVRWNASTGASSYHLQVSPSAAFSSAVLDDSTITTDSARISGLGHDSTYYWHVKAANAGGSSAYSTAWSFTTIAAAPPAPVLSAPANGALNQPTSLALSWSASTGATSYHVQVSTSSAFTNLVLDDAALTTTSAQLSGLSNSATYYWHVSASNSGGSSAYSSAWSFTTIAAAPPAPILSAPANGALNQPTSLALSWSASAGATSYHVQVSTSSAFTNLILDDATLTTTSAQLSGLSNSATYYWHVSASNSGGSSAYSSAWSFTTIAAAPPAPILSAPANGALNQPTSLALSWSASTGATSYHVQVSTSSAFTNLVLDDATLTTTSVQLSGLSNNSTYYWHVSASNSGGSSSYSAAWRFTTASGLPSPPPAPTLSAPIDGAVDKPTTLTLSWLASTGATSYHVQVSTSAAFTSLILDDSTLTTTSAQLNGLSHNTVYYWHVSASNSGGSSAYSTAWSFATIAAAPPTPVLVSPANNSTNEPLTLTLQWTASTGATAYHLQVSSSSTFATRIVDDSSLTTTSAPVTGLANTTTYYWRVSAINSGGASPYSGAWNFTTTSGLPSPPPAPTLSAPANGALSQPTSLVLSWTASSGATNYHVQVSASAAFTTLILDDSTLTTTSDQLNGLANNTKYYWHVSASNSGESSAYSGTWNFTTASGLPAPPPAPALSAPANGALDQPTSLALTWVASTGATRYHVQVSATAGFTTLILDDSTLTTTSAQLSGLANNTKYYWHVSASNSGGSSAYSGTWNFTTASGLPAPPPAPALSAPANGALDQPTSLALTWTASSGATRYHAQVSAGAAFTTLIFDDSTITATSAQVSGLANNTVYYWRVSASNSGGSSAYSGTWNFTTIAAAPLPPVLSSPPDGAVNQLLTPVLIWSSPAGAVSYRVQLSLRSDFSTTIVDDSSITIPSRSVGPLAYSTVYYWRVDAKNSGGISGWSATAHFTTTSPAVPPGPMLVSPLSGSIDLPTTLTLIWSADTAAIDYHLEVSTSPSFTPLVLDAGSLTDTSGQVGGLANNTIYYWRVQSRTSLVTSNWSSVWNFTTVPAVSGAPVLVSPSNGAVNVAMNAVFEWNAVAGAASYHLQASTVSGFTSLAIDQSGITVTSYQSTGLAANTQYYWRVNTTNSGGTSGWSAVWSFTTVTPAPPAPVLASPANGTIGVVLNTAVSWNASAGALTYGLQVSTSPSFSPTTIDQNGITSTSFSLGGLSNATTYYWRVRASNAGGTSDWSNSWSFTTADAVPSAPILSSPANGATGLGTSVRLVWNPFTGAISYHVQVATDQGFSSLLLDQGGVTGTSDSAKGLQMNTAYYWRVNVTTAGGTSGWSPVWEFTTAGGNPPAVTTNMPIAMTPTSATVSATVIANGIPTTVKFQYGTTAAYGSSLDAQPPTVSGLTPVNVSAALQGLAPNTTYHYRATASNSTGTTSGDDRVFTTPLPPYPSTYSLQATLSFPSHPSPSDFSATDYRIAGLPGASNAEINSLLTGIQNRDWQAYWDNGAPSNGIVSFNGDADFRFTPGRAFWIIRNGGWSVSTTAPSAPMNSSQEVEIPLHAGWNLITNPFTGSIAWLTIQSADSITEPIYSFDGSFGVSTTFDPYQGYYFFNADNRTLLKIPYAGQFRSKQPAAEASGASWLVSISLTSGMGRDSLLQLGVSRAGLDGAKSYHFRKPHAIGALPRTVFSRPEWDPGYHDFATDIRPPFDRLESWSFTVEGKQESPFRLAFSGIGGVPPQFEVYLIDARRARAVDLRKDSVYMFTPVEYESRFVVAVGLREAVKEQLGDIHAPARFVLEQNYPNPFNPTTLIPVEVPVKSLVDLTVFDNLGRNVRTLYSGWLDPGKYWFSWEATDTHGGRLASGIYLCRLSTTSGTTIVRKMNLLR